MSSSLLVTKFYRPQARPTLVPRPRLLDRLSEGLTRPLTLISAPGGSGKTTLVSAWLAARGPHYPLAWLALDPDDNDPTRWLTYVIGALRTLNPDLGRDALALLESPTPPPLKTILTTLINDLAAFPTDFALVLDDYHVITTPTIHADLAFLIDRLPAQMRLVLLTRADPPLSLGRLRVRGQLAEIRDRDLRFTPDEVAAFLRGAGLQLSPEDVALLEARTEGWIAGLQLAALSMQEHEDPAAFIRAFSGSHYFIVDYLSDEVLSRQPAEVQVFLLDTAVLTDLSAPLCDAVTGRPGSAALLDQLERSNLFIIPCDAERRWYRYHALFADLLRYRLDQTYPGRTTELHRRAARWYADNRLTEPAVRHALAAPDPSLAAELIEQAADALLRRGDLAWLKWVENLPDAVVKARPGLSLRHAWALLITGRLPEVAACLDAFLTETEPPEQAEDMQLALAGEAQVIHALMALGRGEGDIAVERAQQALRWLPTTRVDLRGAAYLSLGFAYALQGDHPAAQRAYEQADELAQSAENINVILRAVRGVARLRARQGHIRHAAVMVRQAIQFATLTRDASNYVFINRAELAYALNDLDTAREYWARAASRCEATGHTELLVECWEALARICHVQGRPAEALDYSRRADDLRQHYGLPLLVPHVASDHMRWGNVEAAVRWAVSPDCQVTPDDALSEDLELQHLLLARALVAQGRAAEAVRLLNRLAQVTEPGGRIAASVAVAIFQSLAYDALGQRDQAAQALKRALMLAEPIGYIRLFVDQGASMARLLREVDARPGWTSYLARLRDAFEPAEKPEVSIRRPASSADSLGHSEPLSAREIEILRLVAAGSSNREIADTLVLTVGTVKTHVHHIYGKLNVVNRVQATARARELGLI